MVVFTDLPANDDLRFGSCLESLARYVIRDNPFMKDRTIWVERTTRPDDCDNQVFRLVTFADNDCLLNPEYFLLGNERDFWRVLFGHLSSNALPRLPSFIGESC